MTIETLVSHVSEVFEAAIGWAGTVGTTITSNPLLLIFCIVPLVGLGVGLFKRLINIG